MANTVSCREKQRSAGIASPESSIDLALSSMKLSSPEKDTSMPLTTYGSATYLQRSQWPLITVNALNLHTELQCWVASCFVGSDIIQTNHEILTVL